ncbi:MULTISPECIES: acetyl-CoA carboxylase biotin carboxyl carrier protein [Bacillaceae]|uniref:acetyl-CoA carboxylase biotin carboxyl carrier protein n=1 Tax=Bacillaceae TaxID=186817 RepID=UPI000BFCCB46|nr:MULTISPECIES: acetyl-CoA carboxylase biotin carboxyl carrier protein [Bacillaceae]PGT87648.1 acetyl-CoA carboxylase, biotin carboxyl carrier protein [Bacillus sp. AFS040349]UGB29432.1 acetyl-CoA carboxylase biotin carboxyl carrier protein [Metabacillus sp. B2-18]
MLKIQEIREMIKLIDQSSINEFTFEQDGSKIKMKKQSHEVETVVRNVVAAPTVEAASTQSQPVPTQQPVQEAPAPKTEEPKADTSNLHKITSPMVGTFYAASSPEAGNYVSVGSKVTNDSVVCIVEAMKLFNEIEAEVKGEIVEILVENGQLVEYGQPLFLVKPE